MDETRTFFSEELQSELEKERAARQSYEAAVKGTAREKAAALQGLVDKIAQEIQNSRLNLEDLRRCGKRLAKTANIPKAEYCIKLAKALCDPLAFAAYFESFNEGGKQMLIDLAFNDLVPRDEALENVLGKQLSEFYYYSEREDLPLSFILQYNWAKFVFAPPATKQCLQIQLAHFAPKRTTISETEFKSDEGFFSEERGLEFFENSTQIVQLLQDSGFFEREEGSAILKGTLSKVEKIAHLSSFVPPEKELKTPEPGDSYDFCSYNDKALERLHSARSTLALAFLLPALRPLLTKKSASAQAAAILSDPKSLYRTLIEQFFTAQNVGFDKKFLYPHVQFRAGYFGNLTDEYREEAFSALLALIKAHPPVTSTNFSAYIEELSQNGLMHFFPKNVDCECKFSTMGTYYYQTHPYISTDRIFITNENYYRYFIQNSACTNLFLALASLGLFEITWKEPCTNTMDSNAYAHWANDLNQYPYGRIGFIRLTQLGAYAIGLTDTLELSGLKTFAPPVLDENSLIIHIDEGDKSTWLFLEPFCVPLSHTLYKADCARLKKRYETAGDIELLFETLQTKSKAPLPELWKETKQEILDSFVTLRGEDDWIVFPLAGQAPAVIRCIEKLTRMKLCVKMEGKRVAVQERQIPAFVRQIEAAGFKISTRD